MGIFAGIGGWLLKTLLSRTTGDALSKIFGALAGTADGQAKLEEVHATAAIALAKEDTEQQRIRAAALNERQAAKMNQPVFWIIIAAMMGPPALLFWSVGLYDIFWWQHGIWPQPWAIADFPPSIKPWAEAAINWLYDPIGAPGTVGAAALASWLTRGR